MANDASVQASAGRGASPPRTSRWLLLATLFATAAAGCSVMSSESPMEVARRGEHLEGLAYTLPAARISVKLSVIAETAQFKLAVAGPFFVRDQRHSYMMKHQPHISYHDTTNVTVNGQGFLQSVTLTSVDKTEDVILNVVGAATVLSPFEGAEVASSTEKPLGEYIIDPTADGAIEKLIEDLNDDVLRHVTKQTACRSNKVAVRTSAACIEYSAFASGVRRWKADRSQRPPIWLELKRPNLPVVAKAADCTVGLCYRPTLSYRLWYSVGRGSAHISMDLPNEMPPVEIDLQRAFLVTKTHTIIFDETTGLLKSVAVIKPSELAAATAIPLKIVTKIGESLQLRAKLVESKTGLADARRELIEAQRTARVTEVKNQENALVPGAVATNVVPLAAPKVKAPAVTTVGPGESGKTGLEEQPMPKN